ncbi:MAG: hypothetical protein ACRC3H_02740 [Lachnospiraceae bacterium]
MRFRKNISREKQEVLEQQLKQYKKEMEMTQAERRELDKWVASGNSPYDNGDYVYGENGWPLDYLSAQRAADEYIEWFRSLSPKEQPELLQPTQEAPPWNRTTV